VDHSLKADLKLGQDETFEEVQAEVQEPISDQLKEPRILE
jgi:hypothetical protein